jgi:hypothetical protein
LIERADLPSDTTTTQRNFEYLLRHGYNAAGWSKDAPWFEVDKLAAAQQQALRALIENYVREFHPPREGEAAWRPLN